MQQQVKSISEQCDELRLEAKRLYNQANSYVRDGSLLMNKADQYRSGALKTYVAANQLRDVANGLYAECDRLSNIREIVAGTGVGFDTTTISQIRTDVDVQALSQIPLSTASYNQTSNNGESGSEVTFGGVSIDNDSADEAWKRMLDRQSSMLNFALSQQQQANVVNNSQDTGDDVSGSYNPNSLG